MGNIQERRGYVRDSVRGLTYARHGQRSDLLAAGDDCCYRSSWEANVARVWAARGIRPLYETRTFILASARKRKATGYKPDWRLPVGPVEVGGEIYLRTYLEVKGRMDDDSMRKIAAFRREYPQYLLIVIDKDAYREMAPWWRIEVADAGLHWETPSRPLHP